MKIDRSDFDKVALSLRDRKAERGFRHLLAVRQSCRGATRLRFSDNRILKQPLLITLSA